MFPKHSSALWSKTRLYYMCAPGVAPWATESLSGEEADAYQQREQLLGAASIGRLNYSFVAHMAWRALYDGMILIALIKVIVFFERICPILEALEKTK